MALVVNQAASEISASDVQQRIHRSCRRFLGLEVVSADWIPVNGQSVVSAAGLWMLQVPAPPAAAMLEQMAGRLIGELDGTASEAA
jgi:MinD-like ATPase involved in chromosome partitioning or flagellar assembly